MLRNLSEEGEGGERVMGVIESTVAEAIWQDGKMHGSGPETLAAIAVRAATLGIRNEIIATVEDVLANKPDVNYGPATYAYNAGWKAACEAVMATLEMLP